LIGGTGGTESYGTQRRIGENIHGNLGDILTIEEPSKGSRN